MTINETYIFFPIFLAVSHGMWDLSFQTRAGTRAPYICVVILILFMGCFDIQKFPISCTQTYTYIFFCIISSVTVGAKRPFPSRDQNHEHFILVISWFVFTFGSLSHLEFVLLYSVR
jgi:hypothetical protein